VGSPAVPEDAMTDLFVGKFLLILSIFSRFLKSA
jgi:hypothetical protein